MKKIVIIIAILLVAGLGYYYTIGKKSGFAGIFANPLTPAEKEEPLPANAVVIKDMKFNPPVMTVKAGDTVTWINKDSVAHTVKDDSGNGVSSPTLDPGESFAYTFDTAGTVGYHCNIHRTMTGSVVVN